VYIFGLERSMGKLVRSVPRGERTSNSPDLPDTDHSAWIWTSDHFLIFLMVSCHSNSLKSQWEFTKPTNPDKVVYASDIL